MESILAKPAQSELTVRKINILKSPKKGGSSDRDAIPYMEELGIKIFEDKSEKQRKVKDLIKLAFSSILIDCSNLKRTPCLGYCKNKKVYDTAPYVLLDKKIRDISNDLRLIQSQYSDFINTESSVILANAMNFKHANEFDLIITYYIIKEVKNHV